MGEEVPAPAFRPPWAMEGVIEEEEEEEEEEEVSGAAARTAALPAAATVPALSASPPPPKPSADGASLLWEIAHAGSPVSIKLPPRPRTVAGGARRLPSVGSPVKRQPRRGGSGTIGGLLVTSVSAPLL